MELNINPVEVNNDDIKTCLEFGIHKVFSLDVNLWKFNLGKSDNHYKGEKYAIQIVIFTVEANLQNF